MEQEITKAKKKNLNKEENTLSMSKDRRLMLH